MKKLLVALVALTCIFMFSLDNASAKPPIQKKKISPIARLSHSGDIKGSVKFVCTEDTSVLDLASKALIYLEGESFVVKTSLTDADKTGKFRFYNVPSRLEPYKLVIEIPYQDQTGKEVVEKGTADVVVTPKAVTVVDSNLVSIDPITVSCSADSGN